MTSHLSVCACIAILWNTYCKSTANLILSTSMLSPGTSSLFFVLSSACYLACCVQCVSVSFPQPDHCCDLSSVIRARTHKCIFKTYKLLPYIKWLKSLFWLTPCPPTTNGFDLSVQTRSRWCSTLSSRAAVDQKQDMFEFNQLCDKPGHALDLEV